MNSLDRVLVVEDDADTRENLRDILTLDDLAVETAGTAAEVLNRRDWSGISCIVLDRKLPDGNAVELLPQIRILAPDASVIIVTGFADLDGAIGALRNGAEDYILKPINPDALRASLVRITKRREISAALQASEQRSRAVFDNALDWLLVLDDQGHCVDANPAAAAGLGYPREELTKLSISDWTRSVEGNGVESKWREFLSRGKMLYECTALASDGTSVDVECRAVANFLPGLHLLSMRDITQRKRAEERARQTERLAAIGETMAGLVHEGRNALQRSKACLEMLALEVEDRPEALDLVARTQRAQDDLHQLYEEVRQYAAPIVLQKESADLRAVWQEAWSNILQGRNLASLELKEAAVGCTRCEIDRFAIRQVLRNILENAIQASNQRPTISIACGDAMHDGQPALRCSIRDQGCGIPRDQRKRIFEPFFTTKSKGTGLGMAIAKRIIEAHGGAIEVADRDGPGAEVILTLPRART